MTRIRLALVALLASTTLIACSADEESTPTSTSVVTVTSIADVTAEETTQEEREPGESPLATAPNTDSSTVNSATSAAPSFRGEAPSASEPSVPERCSPDYVATATNFIPSAGAGNEFLILYCDGDWVTAGEEQTDNVASFYWDGSTWATIEPSGHTTGLGMQLSCYLPQDFEGIGTPPEETLFRMCTSDDVVY